jgi:hypothetical protein
VLCLIRPALAAEGAVAVGKFQGAKGQALRELAAKVLEANGYSVADADASNGLDWQSSSTELKRAAFAAQLRAFVFGHSMLTKKEWETEFVVYDGKTGKELARFELQGANLSRLQKAYRDSLIRKLKEPLGQAEQAVETAPTKRSVAVKSEPVPEPEPPKPAAKPAAETTEAEPVVEKAESEPAESEADKDDSEVSDKKDPPSSGLSALEVSLGAQVAQRLWEINDIVPVGGRLSPYHNVTLPGVAAGLLIYPAAFFSSSPIRHLGVEVEFDRSILGKTKVANSDPRDTLFQRLSFGLKGRFPLLPVLHLFVWGGVAGEALKLSGEKVIAASPDIYRQLVRGGITVRLIPTKQLTLDVGGGYRRVLVLNKDAGQLGSEDWFPRTAGHGLELQAGAQLKLTALWGIRLGLNATRDVYAFNPTLDMVKARADAGRPPPAIAGGAVDWNLSGRIGVALTLPAL